MDSTVGAAAVRMVGATTVSANYLAYARVLAASWRRHHPTAPFVVLLLDGDPAAPAEQGVDVDDVEVIVPDDLGLDAAELLVRRGMYGPMELSTSLKPLLLATLLERGFDAVLFVDADTVLYGPVDDLGAAAAEHGVVLVPHVLDPIPLDGLSPTEIEIQNTGVFNTGLVAVGKRGEGFLTWWAERLRRDCVIDNAAGLFVDQRWADWVPSYFPHVVLRDPTVNVAYWNLHERPLTAGPDGPTIGGNPLRHFHFSGFDPGSPSVLTTYELAYPNPLRTGRDPVVTRLCKDYAAAMAAAGHAELSTIGYRHARTAAGVPITSDQRAAYRRAVLAAERRGATPPVSPVDPAFAAADGPADGGTQLDGSNRRQAMGGTQVARFHAHRVARKARRRVRTVLERALERVS